MAEFDALLFFATPLSIRNNDDQASLSRFYEAVPISIAIATAARNRKYYSYIFFDVSTEEAAFLCAQISTLIDWMWTHTEATRSNSARQNVAQRKACEPNDFVRVRVREV